MGGHQYCHAFVFLNLRQEAPEIDPRRGIEPGARLIEEENLRPMQKSLGNLDAPGHPAGKSVHALVPPVQEVHALEQLLNAARAFLSMQPVQPSLLAKVFLRRQLLIKARRLEDDADVPADRVLLAR